MKIEAGRIDGFLKSPSLSIVLLFGPDGGLVAERGLTLARSVEGAMHDPFRFAELHSPDAQTLLGEATAAAVTARLRAHNIAIDTDAAAWVANNIPGEEGPLRQAVELLTLYAGSEPRLTLADVSAALADRGGD